MLQTIVGRTKKGERSKALRGKLFFVTRAWKNGPDTDTGPATTYPCKTEQVCVSLLDGTVVQIPLLSYELDLSKFKQPKQAQN